MTEEGRRLEEARDAHTPWRKWGPNLSERQWGLMNLYAYYGNEFTVDCPTAPGSA
jgi:hypothetical protein